jgi:hypothetical protein
MEKITDKEALAKLRNPRGVRILEVPNHGYLVYNTLQKQIVGFVAYAGVRYLDPLSFDDIVLVWFRFVTRYTGSLEASYFQREGVWKVRSVPDGHYIASVDLKGMIKMLSLAKAE